MGVPCWVNVTLNSSLMIFLIDNVARVFLKQDVGVSSPQPQPNDGIAGVRAVPWDDSAPRAVQVVSRHRTIGLMPLLCRKRQERRCTPRSSRGSLCLTVVPLAASGQQAVKKGASWLRSTWICKAETREIAPRVELGRHVSIRTVELCCFERIETLQAGPLITAGPQM